MEKSDLEYDKVHKIGIILNPPLKLERTPRNKQIYLSSRFLGAFFVRYSTYLTLTITEHLF